MTPKEKMQRIDDLLSHVWVVRTLIKHSEEAEEDEELLELQRMLYDYMLEDGGHAMAMMPIFNYVNGNHDAIREMLLHPQAVSGLSDGGAHCGMICDASIPTFMLSHWARDRSRGEKLPLEWVVKKQTSDTATLYGLTDRGIIKAGNKANPQ